MITELNKKYIPQISKIFSKKIIKEILSTEKSELLNSIIINSKINIKPNTSYIELYEYFYKILKNNYPNEYIYKNEFLLQLIKRGYKTEHVFLQEVYVDKNIVDLVVINGKTTAYEIKTEFDSLQRLKSQLNSYSKVFDNIYIISSQKHLKKVEDFISQEFSYVGILIFSKNSIKQYKKAQLNPLIKIENFRCLINSSELKKHSLTYEGLIKMDKKKAFKLCRTILKLRQKNDSTLINSLPDSIKSLISNTTLVKWQKEKIALKLSKNLVY